MYNQFLKRKFDILICICFFIIIFPLFLFIVFLLYIRMGRPIFFTQIRSGLNQKPFKIIKFRTMDASNPLLSDEQRITSLGLFLRKYSIDELPQLFNVLIGNMSLIGPRPLLPEYDPKYNKVQMKRFKVKPGISGLAQVKGRNNLKWSEKLSYDAYYADHVSFSLDFNILLKTFLVVFFHKGFKAAGEPEKFDGESE